MARLGAAEVEEGGELARDHVDHIGRDPLTPERARQGFTRGELAAA